MAESWENIVESNGDRDGGSAQLLKRLQEYPDWNKKEQIRQNMTARNRKNG